MRATYSFADEVAASLPEGMDLPDEIRKALEWCEAAGSVSTGHHTGKRAAMLFPGGIAAYAKGKSLVSFEPCDREAVMQWTQGNAAAAERLAPIVRTGGDGSFAGLWRDGSGVLRVVHLGSGSGSTMLGVLCDHPLDLLRLMAIGYEELCWPELYSITPEEVFLEDADVEDGDEFQPPAGFRDFLERTCAVSIPSRASDIVKTPMPDMFDAETADPFVLWLRALET